MDSMISRGNSKKKEFDSSTRIKLIRKGNELFSSGDIVTAERIFVATDYKDGLVRLGDYYFERDIVKSAGFYYMSENRSKIDDFSRITASVIKKWLDQDKSDIVDKILK